MGMFDTFYDNQTDLSIQLKAGDNTLTTYYLNDAVTIPDGLYFAQEGVVVIKGSKFVSALHYEAIRDKYGDPDSIGAKMKYIRNNLIITKSIKQNIVDVLKEEK